MESIYVKTRSRSDSPSCIWMQAGVIRRKPCDRDYNCMECPFDRAMHRISNINRKLIAEGTRPLGKRGTIVSWKERLNTLPPAQRPCLHHMKGRIEFRSCLHEYRCGSCDFDQYFDDQYSVYTLVRPVKVLDVKGFKIPQGYYFHRGHTWAKLEEDSSVRVGIDEFAMRLLGPLDHIEAPLIGKEVEQGQRDISIVRGNHRADVRSPVSGVVTSVNPKVRESGRLTNEKPFSEGWILRLHSNRLRQDLKRLMINRETGDFIGQEVERLYMLIEEIEGPMSVDGGNLGSDIFGNMPQLDWKRLTGMFLGT
ncbi:MAG: glycine cleavage system protein H [Thermodesulfobacteriota bacterium]|nr:glycine cleavage system protein H [Thermodesulfobacteriota bacterium]